MLSCHCGNQRFTLPPQTLVDRNSVDNIYIGRAKVVVVVVAVVVGQQHKHCHTHTHTVQPYQYRHGRRSATLALCRRHCTSKCKINAALYIFYRFEDII